MTSWSANLGGAFVNVLLPFGLLPVVLWIGKWTKQGEKNIKIMNALKDGQLFWVALTLTFSVIYEVLQNAISSKPANADFWVLFFSALFLVACSVLAILTSQQTSEFLEPLAASQKRPFKDWANHYSDFLLSLIVSVFAAAGAVFVHLFLPSPS